MSYNFIIEINHVIEVKNLIKRYNKAKINAVNDISFYVEERSFYSLLGPNGAGKTTVISILTTLLNKPQERLLLTAMILKNTLKKYASKSVIFISTKLPLLFFVKTCYLK